MFAVADERLAPRMARDFTRWQLTRTSGIVLAAGIGGLAFFWAAILGLFAALGRPMDNPLPSILIAVIVGLYVLQAAFVYVLGRITCQRSYPAGARYGIRIDDDALWSQTPLGTAEIYFSAIREVHDRPSVLILRVSSVVGGVVMLPRDPLTDDDVARLRAATGTQPAGRTNR